MELLNELKEITEPAAAALENDKRDEFDETIEMLVAIAHPKTAARQLFSAISGGPQEL